MAFLFHCRCILTRIFIWNHFDQKFMHSYLIRRFGLLSIKSSNWLKWLAETLIPQSGDEDGFSFIFGNLHEIPIHFSNSVEKGHVAITHMKAGRYYNGRAKGKLKSFGSSGRSLPFLSLGMGTHHEQHPPKTDTSHRGQKYPNSNENIRTSFA